MGDACICGYHGRGALAGDVAVSVAFCQEGEVEARSSGLGWGEGGFRERRVRCSYECECECENPWTLGMDIVLKILVAHWDLWD